MVKLILVTVGLVVSVSAGGFLFGFFNRESVNISPAIQNEASSSAQTGVEKATNSCSATSGVTISYPSSWLTPASGNDTCMLFSLGDVSQVKIDTSLTSQAFANLRTSLESSDETRLLLNKATTQREDGTLHKIEIENTGIGTSPKGTRSIYYLLDASKRIVISYTETSISPSRSEYLEQLEELVNSLVVAN